MKLTVWCAALALTAVVAGTPGRSDASLADALDSATERPIAGVFGQSVARALPVPSASSGLVFHFDYDAGVFVAAPGIVGQLFLESATPIGRGQTNVSMAYEYVRFDTFQGKDVRDLRDHGDPILIDPSDAAAGTFRIRRFSLDLENHVVSLTATHGITDDLELSLTIPVIRSSFSTHVDLDLAGTRAPGPDVTNESATGIGDVVVRAKYLATSTAVADVALGLALRVPSGSEGDFQGTGVVEVTPSLYVSGKPLALVPHVALRPYLNAGLTIDADDVGGSEPRWGAGLDAMLFERAVLAVAFLGRHALRRIGEPGLFEFVRIDSTTGRRTTSPIFGLDNERSDYFDFSAGFRVRIWRDRVVAFANAIVPLNRDGIRADVIPLAGIEAVF